MKFGTMTDVDVGDVPHVSGVANLHIQDGRQRLLPVLSYLAVTFEPLRLQN